MTFRSIMVSNPAYLQIANRQLQITVNEQKYTVALEDIACIILNHYQISLSATLLSESAEYNIVIISCNKTHLPNGIFHSYLPHSRQNLVLQRQLALSQPFKKRLWHSIIEQKIVNQADVINKLNLNPKIEELLRHLASTVLSGDKNNNEAQASKIYFTEVFGSEFIRITKLRPVNNKSEDYADLNALLNYGYTIIRSLICRSLVGYGFLPTLGLFHDNQLNAFNLADDFIEPYRPYIDWYIYSLLINNNSFSLDTNNKANLVDMLNYIIIIDGKMTTLLNSIDVMIKSYTSCINSENYKLIKLPQLPILIERSNLD